MKIINMTFAAELGIRALVVLHQNDGPLTCQEVAAHIGKGTSVLHVSKVLQRLKKHGLVASTRGPKGGYRPCAPASQVHAGQVIGAVDGPLDRLPPKGKQTRLDGMLARMTASAHHHLHEHSIEFLAGS